MPRELNGHSDGAGLRIGIVVARFNSYITGRMLASALETLVELDVSDADVMGFVRDKVATFKQIREVEFIDAIPKNASGKILRRVLIDQERGQG